MWLTTEELNLKSYFILIYLSVSSHRRLVDILSNGIALGHCKDNSFSLSEIGSQKDFEKQWIDLAYLFRKLP